MSYTDVSVDLETLGTRSGSVITQIGLCAFNQRPTSGGTAALSGVNILVNPQSAITCGLTVDWSTISWWLQQNEEARVKMATQKGRTLPDALWAVIKFMEDMALGGDTKLLRVWGHGAGFDITLLECAFNACGIPVPWDFRMVRDLRTLADLQGAHDNVARPVPVVEHDALADASAQAHWIQALTRDVETRDVKVYGEAPQGEHQVVLDAIAKC